MSIIKLPSILLLVIMGGVASNVSAAKPVLNFTDLISGPDTGLGDGKGSGVIVTVWGQFLGSSQGSGTIKYCDSSSTCRSGHVYYWKNADGNLPSGPARLYESHRMQEIAFSIPDSSIGAGMIKVTVNNNETSLPFTVRSGNIFHVKSNGSDSNTGSWSSPWLTTNKAVATAGVGDTTYVYNVDSGGKSEKRGIYMRQGFNATTANQWALVAYPGNQPQVVGQRGIWSWDTNGLVWSKFKVLQNENGNSGSDGIGTSNWGRVVGNSVTDYPGSCMSGAAGAISGGRPDSRTPGIEGAKVFGNYIYEYSCPTASKLHHTTYFTLRESSNPQVEGWEVAWNYLRDNDAKNGIHNYDEGATCGDITTKVKIHNNVVVNQAGAGITVESACGWSNNWDVFNNVLINSGYLSDIDNPRSGVNTQALNVLGDLTGIIHFFNNTIHSWDPENKDGTEQACLTNKSSAARIKFNDNVCYTSVDKPFYTDKGKGAAISGSRNAWIYTGGSTPSKAKAPAFDVSPIELGVTLSVSGSRIAIIDNTGMAGRGGTTTLARDVYGLARSPKAEIGAIELFIRPNPPRNVIFIND